MVKSILHGVRLNNIVIVFCCCMVAIMKIGFSHYSELIFSTIIVILLMAASNLVNDIYDIKIDKVNRPNRPLVTSPELLNVFKTITWVCIVLAFSFSFFIHFKAQLIIFFSIPILIFYSKWLKPTPFAGNLIVASYLSLVFIFIELSAKGSLSLMTVPAFFAFGISLIREMIKDVEDYKGDHQAGLKTLPILLGIRKAIFSIIFVITCFVIISLSIAVNTFYTYSTISLFLLVFMPLFYLIFFLIKNPTVESCGEASTLLKKITILGLIIIYTI